MPATAKRVHIVVLGSFVVDLAFRTLALPGWGATIIGSDFKLGPGGKGSNQAVAAARLGAKVTLITRLGHDTFGEIARQTYAAEGIDSSYAFQTPDCQTGAASVVVDQVKGENAIVVFPGAGFDISTNEIEQARPAISAAAVFLAQLETNLEAVKYGLKLARESGVTTILNPAPAAPLPDEIYPLCDYLTPNESEAAALTGRRVANVSEAEAAADNLLSRGARNVVITLGGQGAFVKNSENALHVRAV